MAKRRIWRERDHPRDNDGKFSEKAGTKWLTRMADQLTASFGDTSMGAAPGQAPQGRLKTGKGSLIDVAALSKAAPRSSEIQGGRLLSSADLKDDRLGERYGRAALGRLRTQVAEREKADPFAQRMSQQVADDLGPKVDIGDDPNDYDYTGLSPTQLSVMVSLQGDPERHAKTLALFRTNNEQSTRAGSRALEGARERREAANPLKAQGKRSREQMAEAIREAARIYRPKTARSAEGRRKEEMADRLQMLAAEVESGDMSPDEALKKMGDMGRTNATLPTTNISNAALSSAQSKVRKLRDADLGLDRPAPAGAKINLDKPLADRPRASIDLDRPADTAFLERQSAAIEARRAARVDSGVSTPVDTERVAGLNGGMTTTNRPLTAPMERMLDRLIDNGPISGRINSNSRRVAKIHPTDKVVLDALVSRGLVRRESPNGSDFTYSINTVGRAARVPVPEAEIQALETRLRGFADRNDKLAEIRDADPRTVKALADKLGVKPTPTALAKATKDAYTFQATPEVTRQVFGPRTADTADVVNAVNAGSAAPKALPGKKVTIKDIPNGYEVRDTGATNYRGDKKYIIFDSAGNEVGSLEKGTVETPKMIPGSRIASGFTKRTEWRAQLKGSTISRDQGTGSTAGLALERMPIQRRDFQGNLVGEPVSRDNLVGKLITTSLLRKGDVIEIGGQPRTITDDSSYELKLDNGGRLVSGSYKLLSRGDSAKPLSEMSREDLKAMRRRANQEDDDNLYEAIQAELDRRSVAETMGNSVEGRLQSIRDQHPGLSDADYKVLGQINGVQFYAGDSFARYVSEMTPAGYRALTGAQRESILQDLNEMASGSGDDASFAMEALGHLRRLQQGK